VNSTPPGERSQVGRVDGSRRLGHLVPMSARLRGHFFLRSVLLRRDELHGALVGKTRVHAMDRAVPAPLVLRRHWLGRAPAKISAPYCAIATRPVVHRLISGIRVGSGVVLTIPHQPDTCARYRSVLTRLNWNDQVSRVPPVSIWARSPYQNDMVPCRAAASACPAACWRG